MYAKVNADSRSDTKALAIVVRDPLAIAASEPFTGQRASAEVTVPFDTTLQPSGGSGTYTWSLISGHLPRGLRFASGTFTGTPRTRGSYSFVVALGDDEGRTTSYAARVVVARRLEIATSRFRLAKAGKRFGARLAVSGGVAPDSWRIVRGKLPRGIRFDAARGVVLGVAKKPGRFRLTFAVTDSLTVGARKTLTLLVA